MGLPFLIWAGLWRKPTRTVFTVVALAVGFLLFGLLQGVDWAFDRAVVRLRVDRLFTDSRFGEPRLPVSYAQQIERLPGVQQVTWTDALFGSYGGQTNNVLVITSEPTRFFEIRGEFPTPPEQLQALAATRTGLIVLDTLARNLGWKIGDRVTLQSPTARRDGGLDWVFDVVGIMTAPEQPGQTGFAVGNYAYLNEARAVGTDTVGRFVVRIADPARTVEVANSIDQLFANSTAPTRTQTENESAHAQLATVGDIHGVTIAVIGAVFLAILFLTGNVVLQSVRERTAEFAVLKTLGFTDLSVFVLVAVETLALCVLGAVLGLGAAAAAFPFVSGYMPMVSAWLGTPALSITVILSGLGFAVALALVSAAIPAWGAMRLNVVDALRARA